MFNMAVSQTPTDVVIYCQDKAHPTMEDVEKALSLIKEGFGTAQLYCVGFMALNKTVLDVIGWMDERMSGSGAHIDFLLRHKENNVAYYESRELRYERSPTSWVGEPSFLYKKWATPSKNRGIDYDERLLPNEEYSYSTGAQPVAFLPYHKSIVKTSTALFDRRFIRPANSLRNGISILIPTWNNLPYLRVCVDALRKYSRFDNEIVLHVNDGSDGTLEYAQAEGLKFSHTETNVGLCKGINACARLATKSLLCYFNDDMCALPNWDAEMAAFMEEHPMPEVFWGCSMLIEGFGKNPDFIAGPRFNYGRTPDVFEEERLAADVEHLKTVQMARRGVTWAPCLIPAEAWDAVGGFTEEFDEAGGFGSDPDLAKKMWDIGCRNFFSVPGSLVYHFGSVVTKRYSGNRTQVLSREIFKRRHGMSLEHFVNTVLQRGMPWEGVQ
jgi:GT2 family glycosyltransferase